MNKEYLESVCNYVIDGHTIRDTALYFGKSERTIQLYLKKIRNPESEYYNVILAEKLRLAQAKMILEGERLGGKVGKRKRSFDEEQMRLYAEAYLSGQTIESLSILSKIPKSTLHDMIRSIPDEELQKRIDEYVGNFRGESWKR